MKEKRVEILAPGGSAEALYAALSCGADAIYTGTSRFSARAYADNPTVEQLCGILDYAHLHGKKIYLTVNTLLTEDELEESLFDMLAPLYESGLDAVIVQDFGVMDFIHEQFPGLELHASTQMTLLTGEAANELKPYGVTRIVPARELCLDEIIQMRRETELEIEVFVHGALCYCYSGQCLMSQVIGGRSGNRGMCAQPCRLPYVAEGREAGYLLSPKDMCTLGHVGELVEAGVDSFKIEGRMKKPAYTALTSHLYRLYADAALSGCGMTDAEVRRDIRRLADIYNRGGFSEGYLFEPAKKSMVYAKKNGHFGVCVGEVVSVDSHTVRYRLFEETHAQDVLEFRDKKQNAIYEYTLGEGAAAGKTVTARYRKGCAPYVGSRVYRTRNHALLEETRQMAADGKERSRVKIRGTFTGTCGTPVRLDLYAGETSCHAYGVVPERAKGRPVQPEDIEKRLRKTGESEFEFQALDVQLEEGLFLPLGSIAALRREGLKQLRACMLEAYHRETVQRKPESGQRETRKKTQKEMRQRETPPFTLIQVTNFEQIQGVKSEQRVNASNIRFHVKLDEFPADTWKRLQEELRGFSYYLSLPAVLREKNKQKFLADWGQMGKALNQKNCAGIILGSIEGLSVLTHMNPAGEWELLAGEGLYVWNERTKRVYNKLGISGKIRRVYGRCAVMTTEGCVGRELGRCQGKSGKKKPISIRTPKGDAFEVVNYCRYCYNILYEKIPSWQEAGEGVPEIAFQFEHAGEVSEVLKKWNFLS